MISKREWFCPKCNNTNPPKSYTCPICKTKFDHNYDPVEVDPPSYHMGDEDFEGLKS